MHSFISSLKRFNPMRATKPKVDIAESVYTYVREYWDIEMNIYYNFRNTLLVCIYVCGGEIKGWTIVLLPIQQTN